MTRTAVGLFEDQTSVGEVIRDLEAGGFSREDVRVLSEPLEMAGRGLRSTAHQDFEVDLNWDLRVFGVIEADAKAYVQGVRRGGVMIFATGPGEKADIAAEIMNRHGAVEIEKLSVSADIPQARTTATWLPVAVALSKLEGSVTPASG
jgi:hypothetical protein